MSAESESEAAESETLLPGTRAGSHFKTRACVINVLVTVVFALAVGLVVVLPQHVFDVPSAVAGIYVFILMVLQHTMIEWPACECQLVCLIMASTMLIVAPTAMKSFTDKWLLPWCAIFWLADFLLIYVAWALTVRGPDYTPEPDCLHDKIVVVTGCNTGVGYESAKAFAELGGRVVFACRTESKAREAMDRVIEESDNVEESQLEFMELDVSNMSSVRSFAEQFREKGLDLNILAMNAGAIISKRSLTQDGLDMNLATNHFGHFLLLRLLLPILRETEKKGAPPRVLFVGSALSYHHDSFDFAEAEQVLTEAKKEHFLEKDYNMMYHYGMSKLAQMMCVTEFVRHLQADGSQIPVNCVHPGEIDTDVTRDFPAPVVAVVKFARCIRILYWFLKTPWQGARGTVFACTCPSMATADDITGQFLSKLKPIQPNPAVLDAAACERLFQISTDLTSACA